MFRWRQRSFDVTRNGVIGSRATQISRYASYPTEPLGLVVTACLQAGLRTLTLALVVILGLDVCDLFGVIGRFI
jgi:hypothetical protein